MRKARSLVCRHALLTAILVYAFGILLCFQASAGISNPSGGGSLATLTPGTSADLMAAITDETGTGLAVFNNSPTFISPVLGSAQASQITFTGSGSSLDSTNGSGNTMLIRVWDNDDATYRTALTFTTGNTISMSFFAGLFTSSALATGLSDETGSGLAVFATSPTLITPVLGAATATTINKVTLTAPASGSTLTVADGKTLTASNTVTFTATDGESMNVTNNKKMTVFAFTNSSSPTVAQQGTYWTATCDGAITGWDITVDAGTATVKVWKTSSSTAAPTSGSSINTSGVALSSNTHIHSTTLSDFTGTTFSAGDTFGGELTAVSGVGKITFQLEGKCT